MTPPAEQEAEARRLAEEAFEWVRDFEDGQFHVHCRKCYAPHPYLPVEFYGLVESQKQLAAELLSHVAALSDKEAQLEEVLEAGREMERRWQEAEAQVRDLREALTETKKRLAGFYNPYGETAANRERYPHAPTVRPIIDIIDRALQATQEDGAA